MLIRVLSGIVLFAALGSLPAIAAQVTVSDAWFRALPAGLPAGGYFTMHNGGANMALKSAASPACGMLMLHRSVQSGGVDQMVMADSVDLPAGKTIFFAPGGYHLMCSAPTPALRPGAHVPVIFTFGDGTTLTQDFAVRNAAGK